MKTTTIRVAAAMAVLLLASPMVQGQEKNGGEKPVLAVFSLDGPVTEAPAGDDFPFGSVGGESLKDLVGRMKKARDDDSVPAVVLLLGDAGIGRAQTGEIRQLMDQIKAAGKEIYVHADGLTTSSYVLLSGASRISVVPTAALMITGIRAEEPYLRGLLDTIGVQPDFMTCGEYKSAGEMFMRSGPSEAADRMTNWLLDGMYENTVRLIAEGRSVTPEVARGWIDGGVYTAEKAKQLGMIDAVEYRQDFIATMKSKYGENVEFNKRYGKKKRDELDLSSPLGVFKLWADLLGGSQPRKATGDAVAIVYVDGPIMPGDAGSSPFGSAGIAYSTPIRKALDEAAEDDSIKAVVLRIDSPGGSAVASEIILDATKRVRAKKPLVVSMGNVAGSGGYYVACGAETIFAGESTITGSIGVVSGKFATTGLWDKVGVNWKSYGRGANSGLLSSDAVFSDSERKTMQGYMNEVYEVFKAHVVAIRGDRLKKEIDELAGGRVFTGRQALELGLVDKLGGLDDAIGHVAQEAGLKDYAIRVIPKPKGFMEVLMGDLGSGGEESGRLSLWSRITARQPSNWLLELALPRLGNLDRDRLEAVSLALRQMSLLEHERVILAMPVIDFGD
jgi:protease-4